MTRRPIVFALVCLLLPTSACQVPRFPGPEIQEPPSNFQRQPDSHPQRRVFPEHEVTFHTAWVHTDLGGVSIIYVDEHPTVLGMDEILEAHQEAQAAEMDPDAIYGDPEALTIDGRDAWGWYRRVESSRRGLAEVTYTAVIPYDSVSYALVFTSGEPSLKRAAPDTLRTVLSSFGIGRTTYNLPLIAIVLGAGLLLFSVLRARSKERADRLRSINLVTVKRDEESPELEPVQPPPVEPPPADAIRPSGPTPRPAPPPTPPPDPDPPDPSAGS
ncbi:MAG: hypothetical protein R3253_00745 [Longimicrobiales bacterium]|nr:hypothetical protein [Longimicrobiales bacterium]